MRQKDRATSRWSPLTDMSTTSRSGEPDRRHSHSAGGWRRAAAGHIGPEAARDHSRSRHHVIWALTGPFHWSDTWHSVITQNDSGHVPMVF